MQEKVIDWFVPLFQRPQQLAIALGQLGYLVIYRTPNYVDKTFGVHMVAQNVWLTALPFSLASHCVVRSIYSTAPYRFGRLNPQSVTVYEYIDLIDSEISGSFVKTLAENKNAMLAGGADIVVASSKALFRDIVNQGFSPHNLIEIPNGVDVKSIIETIKAPILSDVRSSDKYLTFSKFRENFETIVGYFGAIAPWLWYEMIRDLINTRKEIGFVFIGPDYSGGVNQLPVSTNFLHLDSVQYANLHFYARQFDVAIIPFKPGNIAQTTSPLKLFEYFALQIPVVVTSEMSECTQFNEVFSGNSSSSFSLAISFAILKRNDHVYKAKLLQLARKNSWIERARLYESVFKFLKGCSSIQ